MSSKSADLELDGLLQRALKKIGVRDENNLCHYLPGPKGGYIHHFTLRKLRQQSPGVVAEMLKKHIIDSSSPKQLAPKPRAPRGSRKRKDSIQLNQAAIEKLLSLARIAGDREAIAMLTPRLSVGSCRRKLIASIRAGEVDHDLWNTYAAIAVTEEFAHA